MENYDDIKDNEEENDPWCEPECTASEEEIKESETECEFIVKDGQWWCNTHNCWA